MMVRSFVKKKLRPVIAPAFLACLVVYFAYHLVQGDHGIIAMNRLDGEVAQAEETLERVRSEREALQMRVEQLSPPAIDADLLGERARRVLNVVHPHDVVLFWPDDPRTDR